MSDPIGRDIAESILKAASEMNANPSEYNSKDDLYYWEPEFPDEQVDKLSMYTIVSHNVHYTWMSVYNFFSWIGFKIIDFLGLTGSDYDWIQRELDNEQDNIAYEERERKEMEKYNEMKEGARLRRKQNALERGEEM